MDIFPRYQTEIPPNADFYAARLHRHKMGGGMWCVLAGKLCTGNNVDTLAQAVSSVLQEYFWCDAGSIFWEISVSNSMVKVRVFDKFNNKTLGGAL